MGKKEKLLQKLYSNSRLTWNELVTLLEMNGFTIYNGKGSSRKFIHNTGIVFGCHEPHPSNEVKTYVKKLVIENLKNLSEKS